MKSQRRLQLVLLAVITLATFAFDFRSFGTEFIWDDEFFIFENRYMTSWSFLPRVLTSSITEGANGKPSNFYRPIQAFTHLVDVQLFGLNPWWHHFTNTLLHALAAGLIFWLVCRLLRGERAPEQPWAPWAPWAAFGAVALWIFHPLQSEVVGYLSGRGDTLVCVFSAAAALAWPRSRAWAAFFCGCALFSKENGMLAPALVFLTDQVTKPRPLKKIPWLTYWPLALPVVLYAAVRASILDPRASLNFYGQENVLTEHYSYRLFTYFSTITKAAELLFWPTDLHHERSWLVYTDLSTPFVWVGALLVLASAASAVWAWRSGRRLVAVGLFWFFFAGLPTSNLIALINALLYDHWFTVPAIGIMLVVASALNAALERWPFPRVALAWAACLVPLLVLTWSQHATWQTAEAQYENILHYEPDSWKILNNLGMTVVNEHPEKAEELYQKSLTLHETPEGRNNLGNLELKEGKLDDAEKELKRAVELDPALYQSLTNLGRLNLLRHDCAQAESWFQRALKVYPDPSAEQGLGLARQCAK